MTIARRIPAPSSFPKATFHHTELLFIYRFVLSILFPTIFSYSSATPVGHAGGSVIGIIPFPVL